ncbi:MAG: hypothetical protein DCE90_11905 [Pseudanabaena sp.]|nr:MAG: hypothetical protein DCE90_11905 [Pseudanabaena sp.]
MNLQNTSKSDRTKPSDHKTPMSNLFVWANIALMAAIPWLIVESMAGLAVGDPVFPAWFEILLLGIPAIALAAWQQWQQPIYPFSLWVFAKPQEYLKERELKILALVKQRHNGWYTTGLIAVTMAGMMFFLFSKIYGAAPLAEAIAPFPSGWRLLGILWTEAFWIASNFVLQSGIVALRIQFTAETELISLQPIPVEKVKSNFTIIGKRSPQILQFLENIEEQENQLNIAQPQELNEPKETPQISLDQSEIEELTENIVNVNAEINSELQNTEVYEVVAITSTANDETEVMIPELIDTVEEILITESLNNEHEITEKSLELGSLNLETIEEAAISKITAIPEENKVEILGLVNDESNESIYYAESETVILGFSNPFDVEVLADESQEIYPKSEIDADDLEELEVVAISETAPSCQIPETLLDRFLEKIEEINRLDRNTPKITFEPTKSSDFNNISDAEEEEDIDEFADLEELLDRKFLPTKENK